MSCFDVVLNVFILDCIHDVNLRPCPIIAPPLRPCKGIVYTKINKDFIIIPSAKFIRIQNNQEISQNTDVSIGLRINYKVT